MDDELEPINNGVYYPSSADFGAASETDYLDDEPLDDEPYDMFQQSSVDFAADDWIFEQCFDDDDNIRYPQDEMEENTENKNDRHVIINQAKRKRNIKEKSKADGGERKKKSPESKPSKVDEIANCFQAMIDQKQVMISLKLVSILENYLFVKNFPRLFPAGRGGFHEPRQVRISLEKYMKNPLRLSSHRFVGHGFGLYCYDMVKGMKLYNELYIQAKKKHGDCKVIGEIIGEMTKEEIMVCCEYY